MRLFKPKTPKSVLYTIGNPLIAETIMKHDLRAGLNIPPRLLIIEKEDGCGTQVLYHLPSSVMAIGDNHALKAAAEVLDEKLEELVAEVTAD